MNLEVLFRCYCFHIKRGFNTVSVNHGLQLKMDDLSKIDRNHLEKNWFDVYFDFLVWSVPHSLTWMRRPPAQDALASLLRSCPVGYFYEQSMQYMVIRRKGWCEDIFNKILYVRINNLNISYPSILNPMEIFQHPASRCKSKQATPQKKNYSFFLYVFMHWFYMGCSVVKLFL